MRPGAASCSEKLLLWVVTERKCCVINTYFACLFSLCLVRLLDNVTCPTCLASGAGAFAHIRPQKVYGHAHGIGWKQQWEWVCV